MKGPVPVADSKIAFTVKLLSDSGRPTPHLCIFGPGLTLSDIVSRAVLSVTETRNGARTWLKAGGWRGRWPFGWNIGLNRLLAEKLAQAYELLVPRTTRID